MDEKLFAARVCDAASLCAKTAKPHFLGFLGETQISAAEDILKRQNVKFEFYGGFEDAERKLLGCLPDWCEHTDFPITALTFGFKEEYPLSHRDFLGALMSLGIERECVGDILCERGRAVVFVKSEISDYIISQTEKVGKVGVTVGKGFTLPLPEFSKLVADSGTVASLRIDCVISLLASVSRSEAARIISEGLVLLNGRADFKITRVCVRGDKITVRKKGRFIIGDCDRVSKKGRIILNFSKYV